MELYPIYNTSYYAKLITAIHVDTDTIKDENGEDFIIEPLEKNNLIFKEINGTGTLEEIPYYLATTSELYPYGMFDANEEYIHSLVDEGGITIWKYWSGIAVKDSLAFFSLKSGGSNIVNNARNCYYFIYMLNLYINYKLRYFEHTLIDKDFTNLDKIYPKFVQLQQLRNQFMSNEIAVRFQSNIIHNAISEALNTSNMYEEVKENVIDTLELTRNNTDMILTVGTSVVAFMGAWISQDTINELYQKQPALTVSSILVVVFIFFIGIKKRSRIIKTCKNAYKMFKYKLRIIKN